VGRPRKSPADLRDVPTVIMMTEAERAELETRVRATGLTMSEFIRRRALGVPLPASAGEQRSRAALATALLRIGVNLNQIAHNLNAGRSEAFFLPELITEIRRHVDRLSRDEPRRNNNG